MKNKIIILVVCSAGLLCGIFTPILHDKYGITVSKTFAFWVILVLSVGLSILTCMFPRKYRLRPCMGRQWRTRFPMASAEEIRRFLELFVEAFGFRKKYKLHFSPDDRVQEIYQQVVGDWMADALELETLTEFLNKEYGVDLQKIWNKDITLGEIFEIAMAHTNRS